MPPIATIAAAARPTSGRRVTMSATMMKPGWLSSEFDVVVFIIPSAAATVLRVPYPPHALVYYSVHPAVLVPPAALHRPT